MRLARLLAACTAVSWIALSLPLGRTAAQAPGATPTFATDIAPIVHANCTTCHRPGQSAPFSLITYDDVRRRGHLIAALTARRYMPPWHPTRADGFVEFAGERRLTDAQIATIDAWVKAGMPAGNPAQAPAAPVFPDGWTLGSPDLVVSLPRPIEVPADGPDLFRNVLVRVNLPDDRWVTALDFNPRGRSVLHHALFFIVPSDTEVRDDDTVPGIGARGLQGLLGGRNVQRTGSDLGGWVPGITPRFFPSGIAQPLPRQSNLVVQLHLHPSGRAERVTGDLAFYFAKQPPERSLMGVQVPPLFGVAAGIDIPAGEPRFTIRDEITLPVSVEAYGTRGHAHYLGREMKMTATLPDGSSRGLLWIRDWDFGWQDTYFFQEPQRLPAGTRLHVELVYDNSAANPRNPNSPPRRVRWGRESFDEMGSMTLLVAPASAAERQTLREAQAQHFVQQLVNSRRRR